MTTLRTGKSPRAARGFCQTARLVALFTLLRDCWAHLAGEVWRAGATVRPSKHAARCVTTRLEQYWGSNIPAEFGTRLLSVEEIPAVLWNAADTRYKPALLA